MLLCEDVLSPICATDAGTTEKVKLSMQTFLRKKERKACLIANVANGTLGAKLHYVGKCVSAELILRKYN